MKVIKIGADWCSGCIVMKPRWKEIEQENPWLEAQYLDFDKDQEAVEKYKVKDEKLPTFIFLDKGGNELERLHGEIEKDKLIRLINEYKEK